VEPRFVFLFMVKEDAPKVHLHFTAQLKPTISYPFHEND
jgi:hypothetical protein